MNKDYIENFDDFSDKEEIKLISTKANTLKVLEERITKAKVEPMLIIIARDYRMNKSEMANEISKTFKGEKIVIRSSSTNEDCLKKSNAGH